MKCFYHPAKDAVGICKHCARGLCLDCVAEREGGLACRNRHEAAVDAVRNLIDQNLKVTKSGWPVLLMVLVWWSAAGAFVYVAVRSDDQFSQLMFGALAAMMMACAILQTRYLLIRTQTR